MNVTITKCNVCGALNVANQSGWVRHFGVFNGAPSLINLPAPPTAKNLVGGAAPVIQDICPICQPEVNLAKLIELTTNAK
jgi:hypothetical protein